MTWPFRHLPPILFTFPWLPKTHVVGKMSVRPNNTRGQSRARQRYYGPRLRTASLWDSRNLVRHVSFLYTPYEGSNLAYQISLKLGILTGCWREANLNCIILLMMDFRRKKTQEKTMIKLYLFLLELTWNQNHGP